MTRRVAQVVLATILAMTTAACIPQDASVRSPAAVADVHLGGVLRVGLSPAPVSLEPTNSGDPSGQTVQSVMCDPLFSTDVVTGKMRPAIAQALRSTDKGTRFTITLRHGVRFPDGSELHSQDVVFSLSRIAQQDYASSVSDVLTPIDGFTDLHDPKDAVTDPVKAFSQTLKGLHVLDNYSFEIQMAASAQAAGTGIHQNRSDWQRVLTLPLSSPVEKKLVVADESAYAAKPACAGPYRLAAPYHVGDDVIRLVRVHHYYAKNTAYTGGGRGYPDVIDFHLYADQKQQFDDFRRGRLDVAQVDRADLKSARALGPGFIQAVGDRLDYLGLPTQTPPWSDARIRIALSRALDRRAISATVFGGARVPATGVVPPGIAKAYHLGDCGANAPTAGDAAGARAALAGTRLPSSITISFNDEFENAALVAEVANQWQRVFGIKVHPAAMTWDQLITQASRQPGVPNPFRMSYLPPVLSAEGALQMFDTSRLGSDNLSDFADQRFDDLMNRAGSADDDTERRLIYAKALDRACQLMPVVPLTFSTNAYAVATDRVGFARAATTDVVTGTLLLREIYLRDGGPS